MLKESIFSGSFLEYSAKDRIVANQSEMKTNLKDVHVSIRCRIWFPHRIFQIREFSFHLVIVEVRVVTCNRLTTFF